MSSYTSIYFTPADRAWLAPPSFIRSVAELLQVACFDHFTIYREISGHRFLSLLRTWLRSQTLDDDERFEETMKMENLPLDHGLSLLRADSSHWTHMMFPYGEFMKGLAAELTASVPETLSRGFLPWDASFYSGHWEIHSCDTAERMDGGSCALTLSGNGCPTNLSFYVDSFLAVEGVRKLHQQLELLSGQPWRAIVNLT